MAENEVGGADEAVDEIAVVIVAATASAKGSVIVVTPAYLEAALR